MSKYLLITQSLYAEVLIQLEYGLSGTLILQIISLHSPRSRWSRGLTEYSILVCIPQAGIEKPEPTAFRALRDTELKHV